MFLPLQHSLRRHLTDREFTPGGQTIYVGTRPTGDGWVAAVIRIDDCISEVEASWLGARVRDDVLVHLRYTNREDVPDDAAVMEAGVPAGGSSWSVAVYVDLASLDQAKAMAAFFAEYGRVGEPDPRPGSDSV